MVKLLFTQIKFLTLLEADSIQITDCIKYFVMALKGNTVYIAGQTADYRLFPWALDSQYHIYQTKLLITDHFLMPLKSQFY